MWGPQVSMPRTKNCRHEFSLPQASQLLSGLGSIGTISQSSPSSPEVQQWVHGARDRGAAKGRGRRRMEQGQGCRTQLGRECQHLFKPVPPISASETASLSWIFSLCVCQERQEGSVLASSTLREGGKRSQWELTPDPTPEYPPVEQE